MFQQSTYLTNRRRKRPAALLVSAVLAVGAATAAVSTASAGSADERGTSITITLPQEPESWNYWEVGANALRVPTFYNVQETLLENLPDGTTVPMLAEAYEVSEDGLTVTFHIREAKFHDGTDLDAADVVYSLNKNAESPLSKLDRGLHQRRLGRSDRRPHRRGHAEQPERLVHPGDGDVGGLHRARGRP